MWMRSKWCAFSSNRRLYCGKHCKNMKIKVYVAYCVSRKAAAHFLILSLKTTTATEKHWCGVICKGHFNISFTTYSIIVNGVYALLLEHILVLFVLTHFLHVLYGWRLFYSQKWDTLYHRYYKTLPNKSSAYISVHSPFCHKNHNISLEKKAMCAVNKILTCHNQIRARLRLTCSFWVDCQNWMSYYYISCMHFVLLNKKMKWWNYTTVHSTIYIS